MSDLFSGPHDAASDIRAQRSKEQVQAEQDNAKLMALRAKPIDTLTDTELAQLAGGMPMIGATDPLIQKIKNEQQGRQSRKDYVSTSMDQPGRTQTVLTQRTPSVLGKPIL